MVMTDDAFISTSGALSQGDDVMSVEGRMSHR